MRILEEKAFLSRPRPIATASATVLTVASIFSPQPSMTSLHSGNAAHNYLAHIAAPAARCAGCIERSMQNCCLHQECWRLERQTHTVGMPEACRQELLTDSLPAGITGSALSSANCVRSGLGPRRQKKRHLGSAPGGTVALCSGCCCSMVCRQSGSTTHLGTSTPSGVAPTCRQCSSNQHAAHLAISFVWQ